MNRLAWWTCGWILLLTSSARAGGPAVGDAVVAEWQEGSFWEAKVEKVDKEVTVKWADGSPASPVPADKVFAVPKNEKRALKVGTLAFCAYGDGSHWYDCRVAKVTAKGAAVAYLDGDKGELTWAQIIVPTGAAAKDLAARAKNPGGGGGSGDSSAAATPAKSGSDDGFQPTLKNEDSEPHDYTLECGGGTTNTNIGGSTSTTLSKGCQLKVGGTSQTLRGNMACTIRGGALSCQ